MTRVWKFAVPTQRGNFELPAPRKLAPLALDFQGDELFMWGLVENTNDAARHIFRTVATGEENGLLCKGAYIGTATYDNLVLHLFYMGAQDES